MHAYELLDPFKSLAEFCVADTEEKKTQGLTTVSASQNSPVYRRGGLNRTLVELIQQQPVWETASALATAAQMSVATVTRALPKLVKYRLAKREGRRILKGPATLEMVLRHKDFAPQRKAAARQRKQHDKERLNPWWQARLAALTGKSTMRTKAGDLVDTQTGEVIEDTADAAVSDDAREHPATLPPIPFASWDEWRRQQQLPLGATG